MEQKTTSTTPHTTVNTTANSGSVQRCARTCGSPSPSLPPSASGKQSALGRTPLETARAYASMPPDEAETEGAWVRTRWRAGRGPIGRLACACWSAPTLPPPTSLATVPHRRRRRRRVCGGVSLRSGRRTERDKKIEKKRLCLIWPPTGNSNTTTNQKHTHATQAVNVRRSDL